MVNLLHPPIQLATVLLFISCSSQANSELVLQLDSSLRYESNPFRFSDDAAVLATFGRETRSDRVLANDVRFSVTHSLDSPETRLVFDGQLGTRNYARLAELDHKPYAYRAGLEWRAGQLWRGAVFHSQDQKLFDYQDGTLTARERIHRSADTVEASLRVTPDIEIPLAFKKQRFAYDLQRNSFNESEEQSIDVGMAWGSGTTSKLRGGARSTGVRFISRTAAQKADLDDEYRDDELYFETDWQYSTKTRFGGRIAALRREYASLSALNFSAATATATLDHDYSPKTKVRFEAWRRPSDATNASTLYSLIHGSQLSFRWQATPKARLSMQVAKERDRYQTTLSFAGPSNPVLSRVRWGAGFTYAVSRDLSLNVDGSTEELTRGDLGAAISQYTLLVGVEYTFENISGLARRAGLGARR
jgi:hypothetical protein